MWGIVAEETITAGDILFMAVILLGVYLINQSKAGWKQLRKKSL
ncbi:MAG: hypothetical protein R2759_20935 [Bacteroidales bacterium]